MYQINNRFFIGIGITEFICVVCWIFCAVGLVVWIPAIVTLVLNALYFSLFFFGLKSINDEEKTIEAKNKQVGEENIIRITHEQAKQFKKEGALNIDGKSYINQDFEKWKKNNRKAQLEV
jgi:hypothetical protein